jgi:RHH-type proline utilization regulon transcriptional repressor/proline dehydrogenase/delta 1-pyrroline-5-carboxylate dehydrogenase
LENGAHSSFIHQVSDATVSLEILTYDPFQMVEKQEITGHPHIPKPSDLFLPDRLNAKGIDLSCDLTLTQLNLSIANNASWINKPPVTDEGTLIRAVEAGMRHFTAWSRTHVDERAAILHRFAELLDEHASTLLNFLVHEAHKTVNDAVAELREAIDFCFYYSGKARNLQSFAHPLPGPTGEVNQLSYAPRGVFACISPWNFPLAIFVGQIVAALVTGNTVIAKSASQTSGISHFVLTLLHQAGIPHGVIQLMICKRQAFSQHVLTHSHLAGVVFTGSTETAHGINLTIAQRSGPIIPLIAETGGINAMIVDSSALLEHVVQDVVISAFQSAGQRCSSLRLLCIQHDVADQLIDMLKGVMDELVIDHPMYISTDVGPVIDDDAKNNLLERCAAYETTPDKARLLHRCSIPDQPNLSFVSPQLWQVDAVLDVQEEIFGPILHVVRYRAEYLDQVIYDINQLGYGLTLGLHTRLESTMHFVQSRAHVGNMYVNRNMIGAVVGSQPFGGEGLSGTGFKAGGPHYLLKFVKERVYTQDTTASGGNASLLATV